MSDVFTLEAPSAKAIHPFERSGLGKAPFTYKGVIDQEISHGERVIGSVGGCLLTTKPGGTCDHCGTYIVNMFRIVSSDGIESKVGCDCILKIDATTPIRNVSRFAADVKAAKKTKDLARIERAKSNLPDAHLLTSQPHPTLWRAQQGDTMRQWCEWMFANAGMSGKLDAARVVERALAKRVD